VPFASLGCCPADPGVSRTPHVSLSSSRAETVTHPTRYRARYRSKPIPFFYSLTRCLPVKFRPRPVPRCSVQASMSCPSHPLAYRHACGPLASHIATEASRHPAAPADPYHHRCTAALPVPSTKRQCLVQRFCFILPSRHRVRLRLASSCLAPRRVRTVRWHAHACHVATTSPPVQLTSSPPTYGQNAFSVASTPAPADCCLAALCARACTLTLSEHDHALHAAPEPSCPPQSMRAPIRGGHPIPCCPCPRPLVRLR
jgi:hypothetical protein